jgi:GTPase Era involved in 16S rRNA processing
MAEKCGLVAVIGAPNAGKSTLVNALVGQKVAIVSAKAQTTRARLMGIALAKTDEYEAQIILADTPGISKAGRSANCWCSTRSMPAPRNRCSSWQRKSLPRPISTRCSSSRR